MAWNDRTRRVSDGQPVDAGSVNGPVGDVDNNTRYLKDRLDASALGEAVYRFGVTVEAAALPGMAVYYNEQTQQYERALAATTTDSATGQLIAAPSAAVWGVVAYKENATLADLVVGGNVALAPYTPDNEVVAGRYYLSAAQPGYLVPYAPPLSIPVALADGVGKLLIMPQQTDFLEAHRHYRFELQCVPAGDHTPPGIGDPHTITNPDPTIEGWLPASSFSNAPADAKFGYNIAASPLANVWPPVPLANATIDWDKAASDDVYGTMVPQGDRDALVVIDNNGIWWMSNCYYDVPFPPTYDSSDPGLTSIQPEGCPRTPYMHMTLWYTRMSFQTSGTVVTSLHAASGSGLVITCTTNNEEAATGDLKIDFDLDILQGADDVTGHIVMKDLDGNTFLSGPVVEGLLAGANVTLSSTAQVGNLHQGIVTVSANNTVTGNELAVELVRLSGVEESNLQDVLGLSFIDNRAASYRGRVRIPATLPASSALRLRFRILGRVAGTLPNLGLTTRIVPRPANGLAAPANLPTSDTALGLVSNGTLAQANQYLEALSSPVTVNPGDLLLFTLSRTAVDAYAGDVIVLDQVGVLG